MAKYSLTFLQYFFSWTAPNHNVGICGIALNRAVMDSRSPDTDSDQLFIVSWFDTDSVIPAISGERTAFDGCWVGMKDRQSRRASGHLLGQPWIQFDKAGLVGTRMRGGAASIVLV